MKNHKPRGKTKTYYLNYDLIYSTTKKRGGIKNGRDRT